MLHIFPLRFEEFAHAVAQQLYPDEEHEFYVWGDGFEEVDIFMDWDKLENIIKSSNTILYSAAIQQEGFGQWICQYRSLCPALKVVGIIAHGMKDFQAFSLLGCLRFCREAGSEVLAVIGNEHDDKLEYYQDNIGFKSQDIDVHVIPAKYKTGEVKQAVNKEQDPHAAKTNTMDKVKASTSGDYFEYNRSGALDEVVARGEIWEDWETKAPHSIINAHWAGFPIYMQPSDLLLVGNLVQWWKPEIIVEFNAWKLGLTSFLLQMSEEAQSRIIAINSPVYAERDAPWAKKLIQERKGAKDRVNLVHVHPDDSKNVIDSHVKNAPKRMMFVINLHSMRELVGCARFIFQNTFHESLVMFHATSHADVPIFLKDFRRKPGVHTANIRYNPPEGSWYQDGVFTFNKTEAGQGTKDPGSSGGIY